MLTPSSVSFVRREFCRGETHHLGRAFWCDSILIALVLLLPLWSECRAGSIEMPRIRIGILGTSVTQSMVKIAEEDNLFQKNGIKAEIVHITAGPVVAIQALLRGDLEFAMSGGTVFVTARLQGNDVLAVGAFTHIPAYPIVTTKSINKPADFKGKVGGDIGSGTTPAVILKVILRSWGLDPEKDVTLISFSQQSDKGVLAAMMNGQIQFGIFNGPPWNFEAEKIGFKTYAKVSDLGILPRDIISPLIAKGDYVRKNPKIVESVVRSVIEANSVYHQNKGHAIDVLQKFQGVKDRNTVEQAYEYYKPYFEKSFRITPQEVEATLAEVLNANAQLKNKTDAANPNEFIHMDAINKIESSQWFKELKF